MTAGGVGLVLPHDEGLDVESMARLSAAAVQAGGRTISTGEVASFDAIALLCAMAAASGSAELLTGVIPMAARSVSLAAMGFATLASAAPGRALAGVGASTPDVVQGWHGRPYERPIAQAEAYLPALRRTLAGEAAHGGPLRSGDFRLAGPRAEVPIVLAAMNPRMLDVAGRLADGAYLALCTPTDAATKVAMLRAAAARAGRDPSRLRVFVSFYAHVGNEPVVVERLKNILVRYAILPSHRAGFATVFEELDQIQALWSQGRRTAAVELMTDAELSRLVALGERDDIVARVEEYHRAGVDTPLMLPVAGRRGNVDELLLTIAAIGLARQRNRGDASL